MHEKMGGREGVHVNKSDRVRKTHQPTAAEEQRKGDNEIRFQEVWPRLWSVCAGLNLTMCLGDLRPGLCED